MSQARITDYMKNHAGSCIKDARKFHKVNQAQLAKLLNVSQPLVSLWESGKVMPTLHDLVAIETVLQEKPGTLVINVAYPELSEITYNKTNNQ